MFEKDGDDWRQIARLAVPGAGRQPGFGGRDRRGSRARRRGRRGQRPRRRARLPRRPLGPLEPRSPARIEAAPEGSIPDDRFGDVLALQVQARSSPRRGPTRGRGAVFLYGGDGWTQLARIAPDSLTANARFGSAIEIGEDVVLVGRRLQRFPGRCPRAADPRRAAGPGSARSRSRGTPQDGSAARSRSRATRRGSALPAPTGFMARSTASRRALRRTRGGARQADADRQPAGGRRLRRRPRAGRASRRSAFPAKTSGWARRRSSTAREKAGRSRARGERDDQLPGEMVGSPVSCENGKIGEFSQSGGSGLVRAGQPGRRRPRRPPVGGLGMDGPRTGKEYALLGRMDGTSFVDISDPANPVYLGRPPQDRRLAGRDLARDQGLQEPRLHRGRRRWRSRDAGLRPDPLREVPNAPATFTVDATTLASRRAQHRDQRGQRFRLRHGKQRRRRHVRRRAPHDRHPRSREPAVLGLLRGSLDGTPEDRLHPRAVRDVPRARRGAPGPRDLPELERDRALDRGRDRQAEPGRAGNGRVPNVGYTHQDG